MSKQIRIHWLATVLVIMLITTIVLISPIFKETDIHIQIGYADNIMNVWVDTPSKPLIVRLFPPSYPLGTYTLNVSIGVLGQNITFSKVNVPVGEYVIVWQSNVPPQGFYTIIVELYKVQTLKDSYVINVSF